DRVAAVFEVIAVRDDRARQLALLADHDEFAVEGIGDRCRDEKAARFDTCEHIGLQGLQGSRQAVDGRLPRGGVPQQGRNVVEQNSRLWEVWDAPDMLLQIHCLPHPVAPSRERLIYPTLCVTEDQFAVLCCEREELRTMAEEGWIEARRDGAGLALAAG